MKGVKVCILLATLFLLGQPQLFAQESEKARVLSLENAWNEAASHGDSKALAVLIASTFIYTDADGVVEDKTQFLADMHTLTATQIVNENMRADSYGNAMVVTGSYREQGTENGKKYARRGRFTDTWVLQGGQWLCVASQETLIAH